MSGPQLLVCRALLEEDQTRTALAAALPDLTSAQISGALNNAKAHDRIVWIESDQAFRLTKAGREWLAPTESAAPPERKTRAAKTRGSAHQRRARKPSKKVDTSPTDDEAAFRCAVISDGAFFISKDGVVIELDAGEHRQMLDYLERMAVQA